MLIAAIPKSASTSLQKTLGGLHDLPNEQNFSFADAPPPEGCRVLHRYHSDIRELPDDVAADFADPGRLYKQHVYPSPGNLAKLAELPVVVLLRDPADIVAAYRRGAQVKVHNLLDGFDAAEDQDGWMKRAEQNGLLADLNAFTEGWRSAAEQPGRRVMFLDYTAYVDDTTAAVREVERFYGLPQTSGEVTAVKARYSRDGTFTRVKRSLKQRAKRLLGR